MPAHRALDTVLWRKSSRSASNPHCVEVAVTAEAVGVRDTKDRAGGTLVFAPAQWGAFTAVVKRSADR